MAGDHQLLVSRENVESDSARGSPDARGTGGVGRQLKFCAEPGETVGDAGPDRDRVLADAGGEDEGVEAAEGGRERPCCSAQR